MSWLEEAVTTGIYRKWIEGDASGPIPVSTNTYGASVWWDYAASNSPLSINNGSQMSLLTSIVSSLTKYVSRNDRIPNTDCFEFSRSIYYLLLDAGMEKQEEFVNLICQGVALCLEKQDSVMSILGRIQNIDKLAKELESFEMAVRIFFELSKVQGI